MTPDQERIKQHLKVIAKPRNAFKNRDVLDEIQAYIEKELTSYGYTLEKDPFEFQGQTFENVIARKNPKPGARFIIGAHFDSVENSPGADDNASGAVALLEVARLVKDEPGAELVDFVAFNVEEHGIAGSSHMAPKLKAQKQKILGMISLEMIGYTAKGKDSQKIPAFLKAFYPDEGTFLALVGNERSLSLINKAKKAYKAVDGLHVESLVAPLNGWVLPEVRLSDHSPFWDEGYPALLVTDTSFFRNPHYHLPTDTIETLDLEFLTQITAGTANLVKLI